MLRLFRQYYPIRNIFFVIGEGVTIYSSVLLAAVLLQGEQALHQDQWFYLKLLLITFVCQTSLYYNDLYDLKEKSNFKDLSLRLIQSLGVSAIVLAFLNFAFPETVVASGIFLVGVTIVVLTIVSWRFCYSFVLSRGLFNQRIMLLGSGELSKKIRAEVKAREDCGYTVALEVPECMDDVDLAQPPGVPLICRNQFEGLADLSHKFEVQKIIVSFREKRSLFPTQELLRCRVEGIDVIEANSFYEMLTGKLIVELINPSWLIFSRGFEKSSVRRFFKRAVDLLLVLFFGLLLGPFLMFMAILIKLESAGPVFFKQDRVGERGRSYVVFKFRSMVKDAEKLSGPVWAQENDSRVTRVGRIMRRLRIDELPQVWNVLKGDMSFVGPRPERDVFVQQLEKIVPYYRERFTVKPGITGWAQVNYGYGASVADAIEKLNYDLFYIKNMSFMMDLLVLLRTVKIVLFGHGVR
jgi:sugar transferase (PEP-CTERM system associated)